MPLISSLPQPHGHIFSSQQAPHYMLQNNASVGYSLQNESILTHNRLVSLIRDTHSMLQSYQGGFSSGLPEIPPPSVSNRALYQGGFSSGLPEIPPPLPHHSSAPIPPHISGTGFSQSHSHLPNNTNHGSQHSVHQASMYNTHPAGHFAPQYPWP